MNVCNVRDWHLWIRCWSKVEAAASQNVTAAIMKRSCWRLPTADPAQIVMTVEVRA
ncbi:MAG: hypothetical protein ACLVJ6_08745 [Merdibacter sp.]